MAARSRTSSRWSGFCVATLALCALLYSLSSLRGSIPFSFWKSASAPATPVSPDQITQLKAWFKASDYDAVTNGTELSAAWTDASGNGNSAALDGSSGNRPTVARNVINTSMTAVASAAKAGLSKSPFSLSSNTTWTVFAVVNFTATPGTENNFFGWNDGLGSGMRMGTNSTNKFSLTYPNVGNYATTGNVSINTWHYIVVRNTADNEQVYLDGTLMTWASQPGTQSGTTSSFKILEGYNNASYLFQGQVAEIAIYNSAVSDADRASGLEAYARTRYGLP